VKVFGLFTEVTSSSVSTRGIHMALVGDDSGLLWLLSRTPEIDEELYQRMGEMARSQGFAVEEFLPVASQKARVAPIFYRKTGYLQPFLSRLVRIRIAEIETVWIGKPDQPRCREETAAASDRPSITC
jgi:hypothetical protein